MLGRKKADKNARQSDGKGGERRQPDASSRDAGASMKQGPSAQGSDASPKAVRSPCKRLGDILLEEGVITQKQLQSALEEQKANGGFLGQTLVQLKYIDESSLISFLVKQCKIPHLSLLDYDINKDVFDLIPRDMCLTHHLLPIDKLGSILTVAMVDPFDTEALEKMREACPNLRIKIILCSWRHFDIVSRRHFGEAETATETTPAKPAPTGDELKSNPADEAVEAAVNELLKEARETDGSFERKTSGPAPAPRPRPGSTAARAEQPRETPPAQPETPVAAQPAIDLREWSEAIAAGVRQAVQEPFSEMAAQLRGAAQAPEPVAHPPTVDELRDALRSAVGEILEKFAERGPVEAPKQAEREAGVSYEDVVKAIQDGVRSAVQEVSNSAFEQTKRLVEQLQAGGGPSSDELAEVIREGVRNAVTEATRLVETESAERRAQEEQETFAIQTRKFASVKAFSPDEPPDTEEKGNSDIAVLDALEGETPLRAYTFDRFLVGKANAFTVSMGEAVAENPGGEYNPFFLYGDVGVGKTHLISAIGNKVLAEDGDRRIGYASSSRFATRFAEAQQQHAASAFRENYSHWDVLILDDIQFLCGRVEAQEEFFHVFNVLHQAGRQIIIACDKAPDHLGLLEERLVSRFASGVVVRLEPPEFETRRAILRHYAGQAGIEIADEILGLVATRVPKDVRKMIGSLRKIVAFAKLRGEAITYETADEMLKHLQVEAAA